MGLRDYQEKCIQNILDRRETGVRRQLVSMATGLGKTVAFANLPQHMPKSSQMVMIAHREELVEQGAQKIAKWNPSLSIGVEMGKLRADGREDVIVGGVQSLGLPNSTRLSKIDPRRCCFLIIDECHRSTEATYGRVIDHCLQNPAATLVGFTATPNRADGKAMGSVYQEIVFKYGMLNGVQDGWLVEPHGIQLYTQTDISNVGTSNGDYNKQELSRAVNTPGRNEAIVRAWIEHCWPRQTVVFCVDVQHSKDLCAVFVRNGVRAAAVWGKDTDRKTKIDALRRGELDVILCCQLLIEGFDYWGIECVVLAAPSKSQGKIVQEVGRGTRMQEGVENMLLWRRLGLLTPDIKQNLLVVDCCDNTGRHSLVTLPSLFGLNPKMDLKGQSIVDAVKAVEGAQKQFPNVDFSGLKDVSQLRSYIQAADLWKVRFAEETKDISELQWTKRGDGSYRILLPKGEYFSIREDMVGNYSVKGVLVGNEFREKGFTNLSEAVGYAEKQITTVTPDVLKLLRIKGEKWMSGPVSPKQRPHLLKFGITESQIARMTTGEAQQFLNQKWNRTKKGK
jgi:ATP-dependent helicase IRC3